MVNDPFHAPTAPIGDFSRGSFLNRIRLRTYRTSDIDVVRDLFNVSFPIHYEDTLYECMSRGSFHGKELTSLVAECMIGDAPEIVGCVLFQERKLDRNDTKIPMLVEENRYSYVTYVLNIAVFPQYRRYGVGSNLLQRIIHRYSSESRCGGVYLHTLSENLQNICFYEKNGFQKVQVNRDFYFIDGEWKNSILFFYPLHGATAVENPLNTSSSPLFLFAAFISISLLVTYLIIRKA